MAKGTAGYRDVPFWKYALAAFVVAVPAIALEQGADKKWAWWYVLVITVMLLVYYSDALTRTSAFINAELKKR